MNTFEGKIFLMHGPAVLITLIPVSHGLSFCLSAG